MCPDKSVSGVRKFGGKVGYSRVEQLCSLQDGSEAEYAFVPWEFPKGVWIVFQTYLFQSSSINISWGCVP